NFGITRERIRQLQNVALAKLRRALSKQEDVRLLPAAA
ncbi:MAG: sigma factor-like helix-turn-helix DNA-binding protein, partial [Chthoniobacterales bacterium]